VVLRKISSRVWDFYIFFWGNKPQISCFNTDVNWRSEDHDTLLKELIWATESLAPPEKGSRCTRCDSLGPRWISRERNTKYTRLLNHCCVQPKEVSAGDGWKNTDILENQWSFQSKIEFLSLKLFKEGFVKNVEQSLWKFVVLRPEMGEVSDS